MLHRRIELNENGSHNAFLTTYFIESNPEISGRKRPVVVICPGGAYCSISFREGEPIALKFLAEGYHAAVLNYSLYPNATYPTALCELARTIQMLRENAEEWLIDTDKIILIGFSAGGHLVASYSCFWSGNLIANNLGCDKKMLKPNGVILGYPVITQKHTLGGSFRHLLGDRYDELVSEISLQNKVNEDNPPAFIWHTETDEAVSVNNSILFAEELNDKNIPCELHIYPEGQHGLALANEITATNDSQIVPCCQEWIDKAVAWIKIIV